MAKREADDFDIEFPEDDAEFDAWFANLLDVAEANKEVLGLTDEDFVPMRAQQKKWRESWAAADKAEAEAERALGALAASGQRLAAEQAMLRMRTPSGAKSPSFPH